MSRDRLRQGPRLAASVVAVVLAAGGVVAVARHAQSAAPAALPQRLNDAEFWRLTEELSEPNGYFNSDNLLSNETTFQSVIPQLSGTVKPGGAYLGVGPEQNFPYIIALQPGIAFIPDIRRGNLQEHLMYKALFEMSADRAEFLSLLFSRPRPAALKATASAADLLDAYEQAAPASTLYQRNLAAIKAWLTTRHAFRLPAEDLEGIEYVYSAFHASGPELSYNSARPQRTRYPTYGELQRETDARGQPRGYLATEANFQRIKAMEERNLIVPLVGDFAGPRTIRAVGTYLKQHGALVGAFYTSNVENYLFQDGQWGRFAANVAALPLDASSTFIRACFDSCASAAGSRSTTLLDPMTTLLRDFHDGKIRTYWDVLAHSR